MPDEPPAVGENDGLGSGDDIEALVVAELGVDPQAAPGAVKALTTAIYQRALSQLAARTLADRTAARDQRLDAVHVATGTAFLAENDTPATPLLGDLAAEGHNITLTAQYKTGKSTLIANTVAPLLTGGKFLGRFPTGKARRVALLNFEMTVDDQRALLRDLNLAAAALDNLLVVNLRGSRLTLTTPAGRRWLVRQLQQHRTDVLIGDTFGAAIAPSVESENDNAAVRRFLLAVDEIKALAGCPSSIWTAHTGRQTHEEGAEHARGATVFDDWADVRLVLTKDRNQTRFLASEGRGAYNLPESALSYDPGTKGLWLAEVGISRTDHQRASAADLAAKLVADRPGINTTHLRDALAASGITSNDLKNHAINGAKARTLIHTHRESHQVHHHPGPPHPDTTPCHHPNLPN